MAKAATIIKTASFNLNSFVRQNYSVGAYEQYEVEVEDHTKCGYTDYCIILNVFSKENNHSYITTQYNKI